MCPVCDQTRLRRVRLTCLDSPDFLLLFIYKEQIHEPGRSSGSSRSALTSHLYRIARFLRDAIVPGVVHESHMNLKSHEVTVVHIILGLYRVVPSRAGVSFPFAHPCFEVAFPGYLAERLGSMARDTKTAGMPSSVGTQCLDLGTFNDAWKLLAIWIK